MTVLSKTRAEFVDDIRDAYKAAGGRWPATNAAIGAWARRNGLFEPQPEDLDRLAAKYIHAGSRESVFTSPSGKKCRKILYAKMMFPDEDGNLTMQECQDEIGGQSLTPEHAKESFDRRYKFIRRNIHELIQEIDVVAEVHGFKCQYNFDFMDDDFSDLEEQEDAEQDEF